MTALLIIVVVGVAGKFLYDTYITNNTEKNWERYRETNPLDAAKIEIPKTDKEFDQLVNAIDKKITAEVINISELFPEFFNMILKMSIIENNNNVLAAQTIFSVKDDDPLKIIFRITLATNNGYYFDVILSDKVARHFESEKTFVGSESKVNEDVINWESLFESAVKNLEQKRSEEIYKANASENSNAFLNYNGYYTVSNIDGSGATLVLRFYQDGMVIFVRLNGNPYAITKWFNRYSDTVMKGIYSINKGFLDFKVSSSRLGNNTFVGYIVNAGLSYKTASTFIN